MRIFMHGMIFALVKYVVNYYNILNLISSLIFLKGGKKNDRRRKSCAEK